MNILIVTLHMTYDLTVHISTCRTSGSMWCRCLPMCVSSAKRFFHLLIYAKQWSFVGMTKKMSDGKEADILNL